MAAKSQAAMKRLKIQMRLPGPKAARYVARDAVVMSPSYTRSYPFVMARGEGSFVWDVDGNKFIDFTTGVGVCQTGHAHPEVVKAIQEQVAKFLHMSGTDFYYPMQIELAERLAKLTPGNMNKKVFLTNSGTESVEGALKLARYHTGRLRAISFIGAFHGRTYGSLSLSSSKALQRKGFAPLLPGITQVPYGYCYRCDYNLTYPKCDVACIDYIDTVLFKRSVPPEEVAAIFVEPIQGEGGYVVPPPGWHERLRELCDRYGILLVMDEVQSGIGRTGKWFAIEHWGVVPDIVCIAKGLASGMPLGAFVARAPLMDWLPGSHGNTFGGNPVACAAGLATIRVIEEEKLLANATRMGKRIMDRLAVMERRHRSIGNIRGKGLMIGMEFVEDRNKKTPAPKLRDAVVEQAFRRGLLLLGCGPNGVRFIPPLNVDAETVDAALEVFEAALTAAEKKS
jgi:4-aminobutyrate aminotransferase